VSSICEAEHNTDGFAVPSLRRPIEHLFYSSEVSNWAFRTLNVLLLRLVPSLRYRNSASRTSNAAEDTCFIRAAAYPTRSSSSSRPSVLRAIYYQNPLFSALPEEGAWSFRRCSAIVPSANAYGGRRNFYSA